MDKLWLRDLMTTIAVMGLAITPAFGQGRPAETSFPVTIRIDASRTTGEMKPVWRFFGYDEPNYTYMKDGMKLLGQLAALSPKPVFIRTHNLLTSGDGTPALKWGSTGVYSEDADGKPELRLDDPRPHLRHLPGTGRQALRPDRLHARGPLHPSRPYQHHWTPGGKESISTGWAYPPRDYVKWADLVYQWVRHSVERYGKADVETLVLGGLERAEHPLLARTPQEYQALRLCRRRREAGPALGPSRRPARRRNQVARGHQVSPRLPRSLLARQERRHRQGRLTARLRGVSRQG